MNTAHVADGLDTMQLIKGGSAFRANNKAKLFAGKIEWASKYFAVSVSESQLEKVRNYINKQEVHYQTITFA